MGAIPPYSCAGKKDRDRAVIGIRNFNTWNFDQSYEQADPRYQLVLVVAQYVEVLHHGSLRLHSG